jgi:hypothetical protein
VPYVLEHCAKNSDGFARRASSRSRWLNGIAGPAIFFQRNSTVGKIMSPSVHPQTSTVNITPDIMWLLIGCGCFSVDRSTACGGKGSRPRAISAAGRLLVRTRRCEEAEIAEDSPFWLPNPEIFRLRSRVGKVGERERGDSRRGRILSRPWCRFTIPSRTGGVNLIVQHWE